MLNLLRKYLGEYVEGLSSEALRISVWKGDVVLKDLKLKAEALNSLKLPITVEAGFVGKITLKVPWKSLGKEPVIVLIDRVFVLAHPAPEGRTLKEEDREKVFEAKLQQIEEAELATLEAIARRSKTGSVSGGNSWLGSLIATIIGNLKVVISHVHIRYEDSISNRGHPFCSGVTLSKLAAVTTDVQGNETFATSGALDGLCKSLQLQRLALYHDTDTAPWKVDKKWEDLDPSEWTKIFQDGIDELPGEQVVSVWAMNRQYLVSPINGVLRYHRLGKKERHNHEVPREKASLVLSDVSLTITEAQYYDGIKLLETFSRYKTRVEVSHLRPTVPVLEDPRAWWHFALLAGLRQKKMCNWFSWERIKHHSQLRRHYIQMYANCLQQVASADTSEIRQIERALDSKVILLWRLLAHAKIESVKSKEASQQKSNLKRSWWTLGWGTASGEEPVESMSAEPNLEEEEKLLKEEWQKINKMLSYQEDDDATSLHGKDLQNMIKVLVDVSVGQAAARIININQIEIACGRCEELHVRTKMYPKSVHCDVFLKFYGLSSPEGCLVQSVVSEKKTNALEASFVHLPVEEDVDWRLSATIAPCHVTILTESYERFLVFVKRSKAVSPTVTMETATALQMKIEQVTRRAQEQLQMVLEEQSRFALDVDFDAPKVRIPMKTAKSTLQSQFVLDFGHFTLHTREGHPDETRQSLYYRFYISGRDMAAFFIDVLPENSSISVDYGSQVLLSPSSDDSSHYYSLLDRCGMSVIVDQIKIPHPSYPSTRISLQVPDLGIHFSPERYCRVLELLNIFYSSMEMVDKDTDVSLCPGTVPWLPADLATDARILGWRGIGNTLAEWQPCYLVLSGLNLYVLESEVSQNHQKCSSMAGRQVFEVCPSNIGGTPHAVAVSSRGSDFQKALESSNTLIIEFRDDEEKTTWLKELVQATYRASALLATDVLGEHIDNSQELVTPRHTNLRTADLLINGSLVEMKLSLYGRLDENCGDTDEALIIELLVGGGKVNILRLESDLTVKMKLHSLKIKDELQGHLSGSPQYLMCSVDQDDDKLGSSSTFDFSEKNMSAGFLEDEESFIDALPDFMSVSDQGIFSQTPGFDLASPHVPEQYDRVDDANGLNNDTDQIKGKVGEIFYEAADSNIPDFVAVNFLTRSPGSPQYDGIDTQICIRMSALEFFCNRPTLVALIGFGFNLSLAGSAVSKTSDADVPKFNEKKDENSRSLVKGLLGYGKGRVVFNLRMDVDSVSVFLNKEDGSRLATFVQESFIFDVKVYPSSTSIEGNLGNMRLCDMSLGPDHCWGWLCDIRNQGIESLIKFKFQSYSVDDDDYEGHDYSLTCRLSAVRIVFLYRFVQEITAYFMGLASPHTEEAIKLVDKVGGFEWLIQKYEMDGSTALKVDLSLDTPIIIVPKNSTSRDYMQLDLGQLQVKNSFSWHGCKESDPSAVHLDILDAEIHGINMGIGVDGRMGKPLIREGQGIHIQVRRSLRDVFRKVPTICMEIQVGLLHCVMSDKEYNVIVNCVQMNLSEQPKLPPSFRHNETGTKESMRMLADKVNPYGQMLLSRTVVVIGVELQYALLELCNGLEEESPLAQISLEGLWVSYRSTSMSEMDLYVTIPKFSILDIRSDTKPEMRLMLGSYADVSKPGLCSISGSPRTYLQSAGNTASMGNLENAADLDTSNLTMLVMDYRWRTNLQSLVVRVQQPRILVVVDFLLAVVEFFVPYLSTVTGRHESLLTENDPLTNSGDIILSDPSYKQKEDVVKLSPRRQLIVDGFGTDEFIYDGCGGTLSLTEEFDIKGQSHSGYIIVIGCGKKLRFKNVKIENGNLLGKYTYLSIDSSYSVSVEDGVDVSLLDNTDGGSVKEGWGQYQDCTMQETDFNMISGDTGNQSMNVTFEAQVVSPEFTFYDSSKLSSDSSLHVEKLLRAKMDLNFMYASKENDTWARSLVKDLTVEAGSGLVILEPVDISGGYTSVKDKTNISLVSSDICIHLSLNVLSLLLQLQEQATAALQFGNANPLASCTNFKRVWVSPEGALPGYNLTFWRPQAPSNYAILGDCVTSRPIPPSQVVVAVSNTYGRVRKPTGFKLIGSFSNLHGKEEECVLNGDIDCSIWIPIPPPGYVAMGCVAHVGSQPPPNHIVHCLRSDLAASANHVDCMFYVPPNSRVSSGFSIWHVDNVAGSFYALTTVDFPSKVETFGLHQVLLRHPNWHRTFTNRAASNHSLDKDIKGPEEGNDPSSTSGWDILRTLSKSGSCYMSTPHFERIWWDRGFDLRKPISIWRPMARPGFAPLGDCITEGLEPPGLGLVFKSDNSVISAMPVQFTKVAQVNRKGVDEVFFWYPIPPPGYASLGCVVTRTDQAPSKDSFCCPRIDLVTQANILDEPISRSSSLKGSNCWSIWKIENQAYTFLARSDLRKPSSRLAYNISDYVKPRARENVSAEMKLGCLSLSILDNLCGTVTPLIDTTITNMNLASHGRLEAMNAVLICSIAASTFNRQLEEWEPLVEPFDGIFKLETYDTTEGPLLKVGKRVRIAATSTLNLNVSAANLETLVETVASWQRQHDGDLKLSSEEAGENVKKNNDLSFSALEDDDFQKVIIENKLGCDICLRKVEQISDNVVLLPHENEAPLLIPPPRFSDRLNVATKSRETRYYVAIQIFESKGLPIVDDGNNHDYFCALRLLIDSKMSKECKLFPQSARTRCVRPNISKVNGLDVGYAKWNELFIFEVPEKGLANLEVEVTNLASKAGKGELVGALSIPVGKGTNTLKRAASISILRQAAAADAQKFSQYLLKKKGQQNEDKKTCGTLVVSTSYFERSASMNCQTRPESTGDDDSDVGFWVGLGPDGPWESFSSILPLSVVPKSLDKSPFAFEVLMRNGKKHAILRALAVIVNDADVRLEVSVCPAYISNSLMNVGKSSTPLVTEEIFENQRYQPISGWGNKSSGLHGTDPGHWSTRDFAHSSKDFFEPPLPLGWKWTSAWKIERSHFVDSDGWAYGADFQTLKWPPNSSKCTSKSALDFVRRRRWIRTRQLLRDESTDSMRNVVAVINPNSSGVLPWFSMAKEAGLCLQVRPYAEGSQEPYTWSQIVTLDSSKGHISNHKSVPSLQNAVKNPNASLPTSILKLNQLEKKDMLMYCNPTSNSKEFFWLSIGTDASVLHTELNAPVFDWKLSINSAVKLENKLPYEAEYAIWEKNVEGNMVERQHGIVSSGGSAFIYSADLRRPIYLTLFVQGGWVLEKDTILILDLPGTGHVSSFWMVQKKSNRRLRVSVEHDMGGTDAAPKTVRLFVPYWIRNESLVPLSYRIVEVEPADSVEADSQIISRAVKSAKFALRHSSKTLDKKFSSSRRNLQILGVVEDVGQNCIMLSPQDYSFPSSASSIPSRTATFPSNRVGISIAVRRSEHYSAGISLLELERKERVDVKAFTADGSYFNLSVQLTMSSDRTKVIQFLPRTLVINRLGRDVYLCQWNSELVECFHPNDPSKLLKWKSNARNELLKLRIDGYKWSAPFSIEFDGMMRVCMKSENGRDLMYVRVEVRGGIKSSHYEVVIHPASFSSPYRIENRSTFLPVRIRQVDGMDDSWLSVPPNSATSFFWEDLGRLRLLEILADGTDPLESERYNIDEVKDHQPLLTSNGPRRALRFTVLKEEKVQVCRISDWMPNNGTPTIVQGKVPLPLLQSSENDCEQSCPAVETEFHVTFELAELGLSIIDHMPEEILYFSVQNLLLAYSSGLDAGLSRFKLRMQSIQVDNQLPFTPMPVLFGPLAMDEQLEYILKFSITMQPNNSLDFCVYPYLGLQVPDNSSFIINIHEPIIWRLHEMLNQVNFSSVSGSATTAVSVDPIIKIGLLNTSEVRFKVTMAMSPSQRPRGVLGFWSSLMTALGNTEHMPVRITQRFHEEVCMRQSALVSTAMSNMQKDLLSQPLQLLSGVDILGNASSALSNMSKGVAALSMDKKFIQSRQKQDSKGVEDIGDVIREGGGALAKGFLRGMTGILTKPLEGAKSSGVEGFVQGVGKGIIGAAAQPVSGVLDLLSKTTEGANAVRMKIASAITSEEQLVRRRLPRVISGDNLLRPYDEYKATGQVILQLAESGAFFGQVDLFKVRGKFALSDAYEDHFLLRKGKILLVTHRRILLLQQPVHIMAQKKFSPARDACTVLWDVLLEDLATMEVAHGKKDFPGSPPSQLILYLQGRSPDSKENARVIKCIRGSHQAFEIFSSIEQTLKAYGPDASKSVHRRKVPTPYTPGNTVLGQEELPKEDFGMWNIQEDRRHIPTNSAFGMVFAQPSSMLGDMQ